MPTLGPPTARLAPVVLHAPRVEHEEPVPDANTDASKHATTASAAASMASDHAGHHG